jgi:thiamine biosynthesis lipoprotein
LGGTCELYAVDPVEPLAETAEWILGLHRRLTRFEPSSELSRLNARAGEWVEVSDVLHELLEEALVAYEVSGGLVHVGVLPALIAAGYDRTFDQLLQVRPTDPQKRWIPPLPELLRLRPSTARLAPGAAIDLGGLAKGWIADRAVERMGPNSLANCAGDLMARGAGPRADGPPRLDGSRADRWSPLDAPMHGEGWPVRFADRTLLLHDMAAATSGTTKRRWGTQSHHIIDPRTGRPAASDLVEVSVLATSALDAEVLAKTALLLGSDAAVGYLEGRALGWALLDEERAA